MPPCKRSIVFAREPVALARVAGDARAHHVFPCGCPATVTRHDVIKIKIAPVENLTAVLAGVLVALKHVVAREFYLLFREPIEHE